MKNFALPKIRNIGMDSKNDGGIHLWISGNYVEKFKDGLFISTHLTRQEVMDLIKELTRRLNIYYSEKFETIIESIDSL